MSDPNKTKTRTSGRRPAQKAVSGALRVVYPEDLRRVIPIARARVVVGREASQHTTEATVLAHDTVSRSHLALAWSVPRKTHVVTDLGSYNGTSVDGRPIAVDSPYPLRDGALLQAGDVFAVYEFGDVPDSDVVSRDNLPGESLAMRRLRVGVERAAADPSPVVVIGETGTGKEWIARELHRLSGRTGKLVAVNCAALSPQLIESQLFGHVRGAFTGANSAEPGLFRAADGGTLFLDEIGELPLELQPKLLRALQEGEVQPVGSAEVTLVDVRVIAATNRDLAGRVELGTFRRDLYARLAMWELRVPALRHRRADLLSWLQRLHRRWLAQRSGDAGDAGLILAPEAVERLLLEAWPDNLRGLDRLVHELAASRDPDAAAAPIGCEDLPEWLFERPSRTSVAPTGPGPAAASAAATAVGEAVFSPGRPVPGLPMPGRPMPGRPLPGRPLPSREEFEAAFAEKGGNVRALARHFQRDRRQIYRWIKSYGLKK